MKRTLGLLILLLNIISAMAQSESTDIEPPERERREAPVFPRHLPEVLDTVGVKVATDSLSLYIAPEVQAYADSLQKDYYDPALTTPGSPTVIMRRHVESPRTSGVYVPKAHEVPVDTTNMNWWYLLKHGRLKIDNPRVEWPRGIAWIVRAYNAVNRAVNSYDPDYIGPTGKSGKIRIVSDNWNDGYFIDLDPKTRVILNSKPFYMAGINLSYLGIGFTYGLDLSNIIGNRTEKHTSHKFGLGTQMFQLDYKYNSSNDGSRIIKLTGVPKDVPLGRQFPGVIMKTWSLSGQYFVNNKRYSQGAAYSFSKRQKKSVGTLIVGASYSNADLHFDFSTLPKDILPYLDGQETLQYHFHYRNTALLMGYAYNLVLHRNLLLNFTVLPGLGINHCYEDSQEKVRNMVAFSGHSGISLSYNYRRFFAGFDAKYDLLLYQTSRYSLLSTVLNFSISVGSRF